MLKETLGRKNNILTQGPEWASFQRGMGRVVETVGDWSGIQIPLPLGQSFVWFQRGPEKLTEDFIGAARNIGATFVRVEPGTIDDSLVDKYKLKKVGHDSLLSGQASPKATRVIELDGDEKEMLDSMKPKTRYNIRLSEKKGVVVRTTDDVGVLYEMLLATSGKNTGYYPHEKSYYEKMFEQLKKDNLVDIFVAEYEGKPLSATMVTYYGSVATYLHGGQSGEMRNLMAPYLCQWKAIMEAKKRGCSLYDLWGVAETDDPNDPWAGITRFKEGFGGEKVVFPGSYDVVLKPFWYNVLTLAARVKNIGRK